MNTNSWALFRNLPSEEVDRILGSARRRRFSRNEVIVHDGDPANSLHLIDRGVVAVRVTTPMGDVVTVEILCRGDFFGEMALVLMPSLRAATVVALESAETLSVMKEDFDDLREKHPSVQTLLVEILAERVKKLSGLLVEALYVPAEMRVLRRLLDLADVYGNEGSDPMIPLNQEDLAGLAGTSRATVNRVLRQEEDRGTLRLARGSTTVLKLEPLQRRAHRH
ncbi:MAG: Crp/Fnr family transcriptional regulator [Actinomycetota bacterium]|nr:Crp/Fnr family transcriptional regulator [Actinomycetota bacterium]